MEDKKIKIGSNRSFGIVFSIVFLIIALYPLINDDNIRIWSILLSLIFFILGLLNSKILSPLNRIWFKFGIILGGIVSPIIMGLVFFLVVTPISLILRLFKKDTLNLKKNDSMTYWIKKLDKKSKMKNQF
jgi:predicted membrane metal-binding protein